MPRSPKDNRDIRDARREEILAAAAKVFADKGFAATKISDIAAAAGLSHGLVYHYFESKDAIFEALVQDTLARVDAELDAPGATAWERLAGVIERARQRACGPGDAGRLLGQALMRGDVPAHVRARLFAHFRTAHARVQAWIAQAQRDGDIDAELPASQIASIVACLVRGMSMRSPAMPDLPFELPSSAAILHLLRPSWARPPSGAARARPTRTPARGTRVRGGHATLRRR